MAGGLLWRACTQLNVANDNTVTCHHVRRMKPLKSHLNTKFPPPASIGRTLQPMLTSVANSQPATTVSGRERGQVHPFLDPASTKPAIAACRLPVYFQCYGCPLGASYGYHKLG